MKRIFSEEHRRNISLAGKGRVPWNKGVPRTVEERVNISLATQKAMDRLKPTLEWAVARQKISESMKGSKNHFYGKKHTVETRLKMSRNHADISGRKNPFWGKPTTNPGGFGKAGYRKDIECFVRSRWEANIMRVFNYLHIKYEYEPATFDLGFATYTPDFKMFNERYVEVKGYMSELSRKRIEAFRQLGHILVVIDKPKYLRIGRVFRYLVRGWE